MAWIPISFESDPHPHRRCRCSAWCGTWPRSSGAGSGERWRWRTLHTCTPPTPTRTVSLTTSTPRMPTRRSRPGERSASRLVGSSLRGSSMTRASSAAGRPSRCGGYWFTWSRSTRATTATLTCSASASTAPSATDGRGLDGSQGALVARNAVRRWRRRRSRVLRDRARARVIRRVDRAHRGLRAVGVGLVDLHAKQAKVAARREAERNQSRTTPMAVLDRMHEIVAARVLPGCLEGLHEGVRLVHAVEDVAVPRKARRVLVLDRLEQLDPRVAAVAHNRLVRVAHHARDQRRRKGHTERATGQDLGEGWRI